MKKNNKLLKNEPILQSKSDSIKDEFASQLSPILSLTIGDLDKQVKNIDNRLWIGPNLEASGVTLYLRLNKEKKILLPLASDFPATDVFLDFLLIKTIDSENITNFFLDAIFEKYEIEFGKLPINSSVKNLLDHIYDKYTK